VLIINCPKLYVTGQNLINLRFAYMYFGMYAQIYYFMYKIVHCVSEKKNIHSYYWL